MSTGTQLAEQHRTSQAQAHQLTQAVADGKSMLASASSTNAVKAMTKSNARFSKADPFPE